MPSAGSSSHCRAPGALSLAAGARESCRLQAAWPPRCVVGRIGDAGLSEARRFFGILGWDGVWFFSYAGLGRVY